MPTLFIEPDQQQLAITSDKTILAGATEQGIPIAHACGGHARCTTCRVYVLHGIDYLSARTTEEEALAQRMKFPPCIRLACQTRIHGDVSIRRATIEELDPQIYQVQRSQAAMVGRLGEEKNVSALFADIVGYTPFAERTPAYDVVHILNRYFYMMSQIVKFHWGHIIDYYGDGFFASFEQQADSSVHMLNAVQAGQEMFRALNAFNESLEANYQHRFAIRIGIHSGEAIVGTIGTDDTIKPTVIGDPINLASRIEQANKSTGTSFLICETTYGAVRNLVSIKGHYQVSLRGKQGQFTVYEVAL